MSPRLLLAATLALLGSACRDGTVTDVPRLDRVTITDPGLIRDGDVKQLTALAVDQNGAPLTDASLQWSVVDPSVATLTPGGLLTAVREGTTEVVAVATRAGVSVQARRALNVVLTPAASLTLGANAVQLTVNSTSAPVATLRGIDGRLLLGRSVTWTTDNAAVASVSPSGVILARGAGTATVTATHGSLVATVRVTVTAPTLPTTTYTVRTVNDLPAPAVIEDTVLRTGDGRDARVITRLTSGTVQLGDRYTLALEIVLYERTELNGNISERVAGRTTLRDAGEIVYDFLSGEAELRSTVVGGLVHRLAPQNGGMSLVYREPGTDRIYRLGLRAGS